ncbi:flagellar biosynthetic protein FliR [Motilibacter rhizosphaerae]|uniref:Flagellar biosynthetic protein FliR n=1 Tax=Motilibacter rhizosphaerae TaxID=598652 RepID=A0A4Q7NVZ7_9ACTN|nr:flagellar biosynthetic protein FliR [Motilibacter rhizosphaerae]RZS91441.1 flagellar biosynthetic protein FliR [Motilibacter rhizosphaerae]
MNVQIAAPLLVSFLLATVRAAAWLFVAPPFATRSIPSTVKAVTAFALALPVAPRLRVPVESLSTPSLVAAVVLQVFTGTALGFVSYLLFAAVQAAGDFIDLVGSFSIASAYDPMSQAQNSVFGRFTYQIAVMLLFAVNGHLLVIEGFEKSYDLIPLDATVDLTRLDHVVTVGLAQMVMIALEISAPMVAVLFMVDVSMGLLTKVAPSLQAFSLGFPAKILTTLLLFGAFIPLFPGAVDHVVDLTLHALKALYPAGGGS